MFLKLVRPPVFFLERMIDFRLDQPHLAVEEAFYMGYRIPKGSVLLANIW